LINVITISLNYINLLFDIEAIRFYNLLHDKLIFKTIDCFYYFIISRKKNGEFVSPTKLKNVNSFCTHKSMQRYIITCFIFTLKILVQYSRCTTYIYAIR